jgi:hypothetical protein
VTLTASGIDGSTFAGWGGECSGTDGCELTMDGDRAVSADFTAPPKSLTIQLGGSGAGSVTGPGIDCPGDCSQTYPHGTPVTLTASGIDGSTFAGWGGECSGTDGCQVTMDADRTVSASFTPPPKSLTVELAGSGSGSVTGPGIDCPGDCAESYPHGSLVRLNAAGIDGAAFAGWSGACWGGGGCEVTMDADRAVSAQFLARVAVPPGGSGGARLACNATPATIVGTSADDVRRGTPGQDVMVGFAGDDTLVGIAGNDIICGGPGRDKLKGGKGADKLYGGSGRDILIGGAGNDKQVQ